MRKITLLCIALLCFGFSFSQTFNYQAVVRDATDAPVINQSIGVLVAIRIGGPGGSIVYNEAHTVTSNNQGVITLPVGGGTSGANFLGIDWTQQNQWIEIRVDVTGGTNYVVLGVSKLQHVPYALHALTSNSSIDAGPFDYAGGVVSNANGNIQTDDFVFGSPQLDGNGAFSNALNNRMFFDKSKAAFRAGYTPGDEWDEENVGTYSVAFGESAQASGTNSLAMGRNANAIGNESFAFGTNAGGFGDYSRGFGLNARANGQNATAIGRQLNANSLAEIQLGQYSKFVSGSADTWVDTDRLFVIGNGQPDINLALNSDALVMLKNGNTTLNGTFTIDGDNEGAGTSYTLPAQDGTALQIMQTDGSGNVSWVTPAADAIPNGGNNGEVLSTDGSGVLSWISNADADSDPTNEIELPAQAGQSGKYLTTDGTAVSWQNAPNELPVGGTSGQVLATNGSGVYSWVDQPAAPVFATVNNITSNGANAYGVDDFIFGAPTNVTGSDIFAANRIFFDKSLAAIRIGRDIGGVDAFGSANVGAYSAAFGINPKAGGNQAFAVGFAPNASGLNSIALGNQLNATNSSSVAIGSFSTSSGINSMTLGANLTAESVGQTTIGYRNTAATGSPTAYVDTDRLFVIGNGTADFDGVYPSDALVMLKNGNTTLNGTLTIDGDNQEMGAGYTFPAQDGTANQIMSTDGSGNVSWIDAPSGGGSGGAFSTTTNITSNANGTIATDDFVFGSTQLDNDTNTTDDDSRFFFDKSKGAFRAGFTDNDQWDDANVGNRSVAFGSQNTVSGFQSFAMGAHNVITGPTSTTFGVVNNASGVGTFSAGTGLTTESLQQVAIGAYNTPQAGNIGSFIPTDRLFVIGNGTDDMNRSDALVLLKNGNTTLNGTLTIDGDNSGAGASYTLPAQDGTADQILSTDGSGSVSWINAPNDADADPTNEIELPSQTGESGKILSTDGTDTVWITDAVDDADADPTNEIELPSQTGESGKILSTDGTDTIWITDAVDDADADPTNEIELPAQTGQSGKILSTDGTDTIWITDAVNDADADPTNEIELPSQSGQSGKILTTDGTNPSWTDTVEATSVKIPSLPAFNVTSNGTTYTTAGAKEIGDWNSTHNVDLFNDGTHLNLTNGRFTAPVNGLYFFSAQVRIDGMTPNDPVDGLVYSRLMIVKNGDRQGFRNGIHSIRNADPGTGFYDTQHVSGILKLNAGDYVSVFVESTGDTSFIVQAESGFNGYLVNKL